MKNLIYSSIFLAFLLFGKLVLAEEAAPAVPSPPPTEASKPVVSSEEPTKKLKAWYFNIGAGFVSPSYSGNPTLPIFLKFQSMNFASQLNI
jgi:hypothetical protein